MQRYIVVTSRTAKFSDGREDKYLYLYTVEALTHDLARHSVSRVLVSGEVIVGSFATGSFDGVRYLGSILSDRAVIGKV